MPSSVSVVLLVYAAILTALSPVAAAIVGALAVLWQAFLFVRDGLA